MKIGPVSAMIESDLSRRESSREAVGAESGGCVEVRNLQSPITLQSRSCTTSGRFQIAKPAVRATPAALCDYHGSSEGVSRN